MNKIRFKILAHIFLYYIIPTKSSPIVNGFAKPIEPNLGAFPFQANLMQLVDGAAKKTYHSFCGGSLIHPQWILTAAHCIQLDSTMPPLKPNETYIALGSVHRSGKGAQIVQADTVTIHPIYLKAGRNDIGLIKLTNAARLDRNVRPIKLHINNKESLLNKTAYLTGFGIINDFYQTPQRLRKAILHISDYRKCYSEAQYKNVEICATSTIAEGKACKGDSGGPLTIIRNNSYIQIGVTSHLALLPFCRVKFNNSVYTRVSAFISWISKTTGVDFMKY